MVAPWVGRKGESPETEVARGLSQGYGIFNCGLVCPTLKLITPSKALVVVRSSLGSVQLDCEDDYRDQFGGEFGCLADQEKECSRWGQIVSFRGLEMENPEVRKGQTPGFGICMNLCR
jgi:hypothetical protein